MLLSPQENLLAPLPFILPCRLLFSKTGHSHPFLESELPRVRELLKKKTEKRKRQELLYSLDSVSIELPCPFFHAGRKFLIFESTPSVHQDLSHLLCFLNCSNRPMRKIRPALKNKFMHRRYKSRLRGSNVFVKPEEVD